MTVRDAFTDEEWSEIVLAPMLASFAVTAADPSGLFGVIRESSAAARAMEAARADGDDITREVMATYDTPEGREAASDAVSGLARGRSPEEAAVQAIARLSDVSRLLKDRGVEATGFRTWIRGIARDVAEASTEGGFLGFGGEKISDEERRRLAQIDAALSDRLG